MNEGVPFKTRSGLYQRGIAVLPNMCRCQARACVSHCPRGAQRSGPKAAKRLPPCHRPSFCDARQTVAVRARCTCIHSLRSRLPHVSRNARENSLHAVTIFHSRSLSLTLSPLSRYRLASSRKQPRSREQYAEVSRIQEPPTLHRHALGF